MSARRSQAADTASVVTVMVAPRRARAAAKRSARETSSTCRSYDSRADEPHVMRPCFISTRAAAAGAAAAASEAALASWKPGSTYGTAVAESRNASCTSARPSRWLVSVRIASAWV